MFRFVPMLGCFALALHGAHVHSQGFESAGLDDTVNPSHSLANALLALNPLVPTSARRSLGAVPEHTKREKKCPTRILMAKADEIPDVGRGAKVRQFLRENPGGMVVMKLQESGSGRSGKANMMAYRSSNGNPNAFYADEERRGIMNLLMFGSAGGFAVPFLLTYVYYFIPPIPDANKGIPAKTGIGKEIFFKEWYSTHEAGDRDLVQGVKGQATWLIINEEGKVKDFAVTAVCTHLGCIVPWNKGQNKFMCPCHGSQYDTNGKVVRGPAPLSLALQHVDEGPKDAIYVRQWTERDFRTGEAPWWIK